MTTSNTWVCRTGWGLACLLASCAAEPPAPPEAAAGDTADSFAARPMDPARTAALVARARAFVRPGSVVQTEPRLGVPTFVWTRDSLRPSARAPGLYTGVVRPEVAAARAVLADFAPLYGLSDADVSGAVVASVHDLGTGPILVKYRARRDGIEIFREELNVVLDRKLESVAISGYLTSVATPAARAGALAFHLAAPAAAVIAVHHLAQLGPLGTTAIDPARLVAAGTRDGYSTFTLPPAAGVVLDEPIRTKQVYFHLPEGLEAAYYIEVQARTGPAPAGVLSADGSPLVTSEAYAYVVSAATGQLLFRKNLAADAASVAREASALGAGGFTYRVWADPVTGIPLDTPAGNVPHPKAAPVPDGVQAAFLAPSDVTLPNYPFSRNDPWLAPGATETVGNNVDAFLNLFAPDGYLPPIALPTDPPTGDFRAQLTAPGQFLHAQIPDGNVTLAEGRQGAIQQLFYNNNFLHDWYYDAGFDEASGNAQTDNFGRGGLGNDSIKAQAQDFSGFANANMSTPADGGRPRMRMYMFPSLANMIELQAPAALAGKLTIGVSMSGPQAFDLTADVAIAAFTAAPACAVSNAAALDGKIAMFDFDNTDATGCSFSTRIARLTTTTTAQAILMVYTSLPPNGPGGAANVSGYVPANTRPFASISWTNGLRLKAQLTAGETVTARLFRTVDRDGSIDNQIVFHEFFHYVSNRLVGNGSGLNTNHAAGMGEGWSDFNAMLLTVRDDDAAIPSDATFNGVYALATFATSGVPFNGSANQAYYFGIRRYPYSTDMTRNPLTFGHITNGVALPVGPPVRFGADGASNAEVHNTGEVWSTMLWECYAALLRSTQGPTPHLTFPQAQDRMKRYVIAALKITPLFPTITEARDALLAVALASDLTDYIAFKVAFAKRGAGAHAVSPDRFSQDNAGVVEDFADGPDLSLVSATLDDGLGSCDHDGVLDHGEYGRLTVTLRNTGTVALSATTAAISSPSPDVFFPSGTTLAFPALALGATASVSLRVAYPRSVTGIRELDFQIDFTDAQLAAPLHRLVGFRANTDELATGSATDSVEPVATRFTTGVGPGFLDLAPWHRAEITPLAHAWHADDPGAGSDQYLISPPLTVDDTGTLTLQLDHAWSFEFDDSGNFDGGVIEMSVAGGAFTDIGGPAYNGAMINYAGDVNPLRGRPGFVQTSGGSVHTTLTQTVAPGSTVQIRFRAASDGAVGSAGWTIDNLAITGIKETPFGSVVEDGDPCTQVPAAADLAITVSDGVTSVHVGDPVRYTITASNVGGDDILGAIVSDAFPSDLSCSWTCAASPGSQCTASGRGSLFDRATLPAGGTATYTASCTLSPAAASSALVNTATIALPGALTDPAPANNTATDSDAVIRIPAHLTATKTVTGSFLPGGTVSYAIELANDGPGMQFDNAGNELVDVLPAGLQLVSAAATGGTAAAALDANTVTWNGAIAAGGSVTITIVATITATVGTAISNQATFAYDADGDAVNEASGTTEAFPCPPLPAPSRRTR